MSDAPGPSRFYKEASVVAIDGAFAVQLDGRTAKTPRRAQLLAPTRALADAVAAEWSAQGEHILKDTMPLHGLLARAIDLEEAGATALRKTLVGYGQSDLLCYRAPHPEALIARQADAWDPIIAWAEEELGLSFAIATGIMPQPQPLETADGLAKLLQSFASARLVALAELTECAGSLLLALAVAHGRLFADDAFKAARIDETFQADQWGEDAEAVDRERRLAAAFAAAAQFLRLASE